MTRLTADSSLAAGFLALAFLAGGSTAAFLGASFTSAEGFCRVERLRLASPEVISSLVDFLLGMVIDEDSNALEKMIWRLFSGC
jgi:hypothetical protein